MLSLSVRVCFPVATSQSRTPSPEAVASVAPSGANAREKASFPGSCTELATTNSPISTAAYQTVECVFSCIATPGMGGISDSNFPSGETASTLRIAEVFAHIRRSSLLSFQFQAIDCRRDHPKKVSCRPWRTPPPGATLSWPPNWIGVVLPFRISAISQTGTLLVAATGLHRSAVGLKKATALEAKIEICQGRQFSRSPFRNRPWPSSPTEAMKFTRQGT